MSTKIVKASDPDIISLKHFRWSNCDGYYFNPLTDQVYSSVAPKHSVDNLFPLTAEISNNGRTLFKLRGVRFWVEQIHDALYCHPNLEIRKAYNKIMACKPDPTTQSVEKVSTQNFEKVTDWRTLKVGDRIKTDDPVVGSDIVVTVGFIAPLYFFGIEVNEEDTINRYWIDVSYDIWKQVSSETQTEQSPSKGWVIMELDSGGGLIPLDDSGSIDVYKSEDDAFRFFKQLCDTHHDITFVKLKIENFGVTTSNPTFQLT